MRFSVTGYTRVKENKIDEEKLLDKRIKKLKIRVHGIKVKGGQVIISLYNKDLFEIADKYAWKGGIPKKMEIDEYNRIINAKLLKDSDRKILNSIFKLNTKQNKYYRKQKPEIEDTNSFLEVFYKLIYSKTKKLKGSEVTFLLEDVKQDYYYITAMYDGNNNGVYEWQTDFIRTVFGMFSGTPTFETHSILLNKDEIELDIDVMNH
jgi:hypothetical protein